MRAVQMHGVDLGPFQFQGQLTWAAVFLNVDGTIYGRYGSRGERHGRTENEKDISVEGLKLAAAAALEIHKGYPANAASLAGKRGPAPLARTPERLPAAPPEEARPAGPRHHGCIHCHQVQDWELMSVWESSRPVPDRLLWPHPMPDVLGLSLDPRERATVSSVAEGSPARRAGFQPGDKVVAAAGQPVISIADMQWVLHQAPEPSSLPVEVERAGGRARLELTLAEGWRRGGNFADSLSLGWTVRMFVAGMKCDSLGLEEKRRLGLTEGALALRIDEITPDFVKRRNRWAAQAGLRKGDVIVDVDGRRASMTESQLLAYIVQRKSPGQRLDLTYLRGGERRTVKLDLPGREGRP
ncbi:MAG: PDZ domain-containing protein [Planctomycetes bacterium]|nr:PDZ domain-containing protein [Planctomycetota bacterium]